MTKLEEAFVKAARELSPEAKAELANILLGDLDEPEQRAVDEAWAIEIRRRIEAMDRGEGSSKPSDEVVARLRQKRSA
jgi:putative addiction module component (TIGR02574 family)